MAMNPSTGYSWFMHDNKCALTWMKSVDSAYDRAGVYRKGSGGHHLWTFNTPDRPEEPCTVRFELKRPWEVDTDA